MRKPHLRTLLAAAVVGSAGSFAIAQEGSQLDVDRPSQDQAVITIERQGQQQGQQLQQARQAQNQQTVRGTVVSLETYLREGASAARNEQARGAGTERPMALLTDDGQLYVILDQPVRDGSMAGAQEMQQDQAGAYGMADPARADRQASDDDRPRTAAPLASDPEDPHKIQQSPGYELDTGADPDASARAGTSSERNARAEVDRDADRPQTGRASIDLDERDEIANQRSPAPGRERHTNRADKSASDPTRRAENLGEIIGDERQAERGVDDQTQVYGMADPQQRDKHAQKDKLKVGEQVTLRGQVFERDNVRGISVSEVQSTQ